MVYVLRLKIDTWLKQSTAQGVSLPDDQRQLVRAGILLPLSSFELAGHHLKITLGQNDQGQQISFKGHNDWYVYEPAIEVLQDGRAIDLETQAPLAPAYSLKVDLNTWFKQSTAQSSTLSDNDKQFVRQGTVLPVASFAPAGKFHIKVALGIDRQGKQMSFKGRETWYVYRPVVDVLRDGKEVDIPAPAPEGPVYSLNIKSDTWLKLSTAQSATLPDEQKQFLQAGTTLPVSSFALVGKYHLKIALGLDERGKQVSFKGRNTWYAYRPATEMFSNGKKLDLPALAPQNPVYSLKTSSGTWLKLSTAQSSSLPDTQKQFLQAGTTLPVANFAPVGQYHLKVSLGLDDQNQQVSFKGRNTWYAYRPSVQMFRDGQFFQPAALQPAPQPSTSTASGSTGQMNAKGLHLLKSFEGLRLTAYIDAVGVWTIGYGTTRGVKRGMKITKAQAENLMKRDLVTFESAVRKYTKVPLNSDQFSALVSFTYNVGVGAFSKSTLLRMLNQKNIRGAADQFLRWNKGGGRELPGLTRRRKAERALFLGEDYTKFL